MIVIHTNLEPDSNQNSITVFIHLLILLWQFVYGHDMAIATRVNDMQTAFQPSTKRPNE